MGDSVRLMIFCYYFPETALPSESDILCIVHSAVSSRQDSKKTTCGLWNNHPFQ